MLNTLVHNHYVHKGSLWAIYIATFLHAQRPADNATAVLHDGMNRRKLSALANKAIMEEAGLGNRRN